MFNSSVSCREYDSAEFWPILREVALKRSGGPAAVVGVKNEADEGLAFRVAAVDLLVRGQRAADPVREEALFVLIDEETSELERSIGDLRPVLERFDNLSMRAHMANHPRTVYRAISHSIIASARRCSRRCYRPATRGVRSAG